MSFKRLGEMQRILDNIKYLNSDQRLEILDGSRVLLGEFNDFADDVMEYLESELIENDHQLQVREILP